MAKRFQVKNGYYETFLCGCMFSKMNGHEFWDKCKLHKRANELESKGFDIEKSLTISLMEQIAGG